jgi:cytochrome c-type biogenesis protein CcmH
MIRTLFMALFILVSALPALAVNPDEVLSDPALEARARHLSANLRCLVCQNQSIDDSNADLAKDLRLLLRERIMAGDSDEEVMAYLVSRYGEFVLLKPPLSGRTIALWSAPFVFLLLGGLVLVVSLRNRRAVEAATKLSAEEQARINELLEK